MSTCRAIGSAVHGAIVLLLTAPVTISESPVFISGTISQRTALLGSVGSTAPQGGKFPSPPFVNWMNQCVLFVLMNGLSLAASSVSVDGFPSQLVGYGLYAEIWL